MSDYGKWEADWKLTFLLYGTGVMIAMGVYALTQIVKVLQAILEKMP